MSTPKVRKSRNLRPIQVQRNCGNLDKPDMYSPNSQVCCFPPSLKSKKVNFSIAYRFGYGCRVTPRLLGADFSLLRIKIFPSSATFYVKTSILSGKGANSIFLYDFLMEKSSFYPKGGKIRALREVRGRQAGGAKASHIHIFTYFGVFEGDKYLSLIFINYR